VVVLVLSALLVNTRTGRESSAAAPGPATSSVSFDTGGPNGRGTLEAELAPARPGRNEVRLVLVDATGRAYNAAQVTASLTLTAQGIGPLAVPVAGDGPGAYTATVDGVSTAGTWTLAVTIRSDDVDETTVRVTLPVR
jgi:copper transport protein